jgi:uncharacterized damage-inducible protein DinB
MDPATALREVILPAWRTNARVTEGLVRAIPPKLLAAPIPGSPRRTVRMLAAHLHNARCMWLRTLGQPLGVQVPSLVDRRRATKRELVQALRRSAAQMEALLVLGCNRGGRVPPTPKYVWRNLALDVGHVLTYFVAHEAHHRGQLSLISRALGVPLPKRATIALWQWKPPVVRPRGRRPADA